MQTSDVLRSAEKTIKAIDAERHGFDQDVIRFAQRYGTSETKKAVLMRIFKITSARLADADREKLISELREVIHSTADTFSREHHQKNLSQLLQKELRLTEKVQENRELAFKCMGLGRSLSKDFTLGPLDLNVHKGEVYGVIGENGNGKTTLFRIICGELTHDKGSIEYPFLNQSSEGSKRISWGLVKSKIAYVQQELPKWSGDLRSNLQYEAASHGILGADNVAQVDYVIERLGLGDYLNHKWKQLSGGYKLRFALARALVWQPDILILDEPLANLDVNAQQSVIQDIKNLASSLSHPIAVFVSSQHIHEIEAIADKLLFLRKGTPLYNGPLEKLGEDRKVNTFEVGTNASYREFVHAFPETMPVTITQGVLCFRVTTPLNINKNEILGCMLNQGLELNYFRDISRSSRQMFIRAA